MLTPSNSDVQKFAVAVETVLRNIRHVRPDLELTSILTWANAQGHASGENDTLHYLNVAYRAVERGEPLPWLPKDLD